MVIPHFVFFSDPLKVMEGNYPAVLINHRNLYYPHKVFQVAYESRDCTQSTWFIFQFCSIFTEGEKRGKVTNCGNGSWKSLLPHGLTSCALNDETKVETVLFRK